jgi:hypothetical protein
MSCPALTPGATPATLIVSGPWTAAQSAYLERLVAASPSIDARLKSIVIDISGKNSRCKSWPDVSATQGKQADRRA